MPKADTPDKPIEQAYKEAQEIVALTEDPKTKAEGSSHPILPGVSEMTGDRIMAIVSLKAENYTDERIAELIGMKQGNISKLRVTYPKAFHAAEAHFVKAADRLMAFNIVRVRASLTKAAPEAVEALRTLVNDKDCPHHIRRSAAVDILNLCGVGYSRKTVGGRDARVQVTQINNIREAIDDKWLSDAEAYVDAEDAEVVEEENS